MQPQQPCSDRSKAGLFDMSTAITAEGMRYANAISLYSNHDLCGRVNCHGSVAVDHPATAHTPAIWYFRAPSNVPGAIVPKLRRRILNECKHGGLAPTARPWRRSARSRRSKYSKLGHFDAGQETKGIQYANAVSLCAGHHLYGLAIGHRFVDAGRSNTIRERAI